jgi:hypothetical protein
LPTTPADANAIEMAIANIIRAISLTIVFFAC